jgi:type IV pilus assembly protein PilW
MQSRQILPSAARQQGFTLVELMVTVAIALFLLYGLVTTVQNVRQTSLNQQQLAQLQDEQRFAMTVLTDVIQAGGYYPDPLTQSLPLTYQPNAPFGDGWPFYGTHPGAPNPDSISVRVDSASGDGIINCQGGSNVTGATHLYTNVFTVAGGQLLCAVGIDAGPIGAPQALVNNVQNLQIMFGVKRIGVGDYNVDTYVTPDNMGPSDWTAISSVRVSLTLGNPLYAPGGTQPQFITFDRVIEVMARAGAYT